MSTVNLTTQAKLPGHRTYNLTNNILGWGCFLVAAITYLMTMGHTASLWDCAEFIACDSQLEVGHPPGAPFYMLVYNLFSQFASDPTQIALWCNIASGLISALTILLLFWTITHLMRRLVCPKYRDGEPMSFSQMSIIFGAGLVGALTYTFTDTFWFSAIEAEVYSFSSFCTALVFWLMFKWDDRADEPSADRWLVLIAYCIGLSIGVHLLNLLCIPAMGLIYYYRKSEKPSLGKSVLVIFGCVIVIGIILGGFIQGIFKIAGYFDLVAVNYLGFSFNTGAYFYYALVTVTLALSVIFAHKAYREKLSTSESIKRVREYSSASSSYSFAKLFASLSIVLIGIPFVGAWFITFVMIAALIILSVAVRRRYERFLYVLQLCLVVMVLGFASYGVIIIRAVANPPMNENQPDNPFALKSYLNRDQYAKQPLLLGPTYASQPAINESGTNYVMNKTFDYEAKTKTNPNEPDEYLLKENVLGYKYNLKDQMLFPRVWDDGRAAMYKSWLGKYPGDNTLPTQVDNMKFFFSYQLGYMYGRYFGWNFIGRMNDLQGDGSPLKGGIATGIPFVDKVIVGNNPDGPDAPDIFSKNKGHNVYYMLPFILGLLGILFQITNKDEKEGYRSFWIVFWLFLMTGIAIIVYLNQQPGQPRERDYAYAGSFYAYAIWIGMGVGMLAHLLRRLVGEKSAGVIATILGLIVPLQMASQNWDDHDRSRRTIARDIAINYLESCRPNAILFCYGDNDTFPLWYIQSVEGVRRDIRSCNLSYLSGAYYIRQMKQEAYSSAPLPINSLSQSFYDKHGAVLVNPDTTCVPLNESLKALPHTTVSGYSNGDLVAFPSSNMTLSIPQAIYQYDDFKSVPDSCRIHEMNISLKGKSQIVRDALAILDIINNNKDWKRPVYWCASSPTTAFSNMDDYLVPTAMSTRLYPAKLNGIPPKNEVDWLYNVVMTKFRWGGAQDPKAYLDENARMMMDGIKIYVFHSLSTALIHYNEMDKARKLLELSETVLNPEVIPYSIRTLGLISLMYQVKLDALADKIATSMMVRDLKFMHWVATAINAPALSQSRIYIERRYEIDQLLEMGSEFKRPWVADYMSLMPKR